MSDITNSLCVRFLEYIVCFCCFNRSVFKPPLHSDPNLVLSPTSDSRGRLVFIGDNLRVILVMSSRCSVFIDALNHVVVVWLVVGSLCREER